MKKQTISAAIALVMLITASCSSKVEETTVEETIDTTTEAVVTTTTSETSEQTTEETSATVPSASDMSITEVMTMLIEASGRSVDESVDRWKTDDGLDSYRYTDNPMNVEQGIEDDRFFFFDYQENAMCTVMEVIRLDTDSDLYNGLSEGDVIRSYLDDDYVGASVVAAVRCPYVLCICESFSSTYDAEHNSASGDTNTEPPYSTPGLQDAYEAFLALE